jgi:hypothetical protein
MSKKSIDENEFAGAPGGVGASNYQTPLNTHASPLNFQDPDKFNSADRNKSVDNHSNTRKDNVGGPKDLLKTVDAIYSKKIVPTADEVKAGLDFEISNMIKPDKARAKEMVLKNLLRDPQYYGKLRQLNIDDEHMQINLKEESDQRITKNILNQMKEAMAPKAPEVDEKMASAIAEAMRQTMEDRKKIRPWQKGDPTL